MAKDFNNLMVVDGYDEHIRKLIPGYELIHLQVHALLETYLNLHAHILIVGCGTGYELQYLLEQFPTWTFTAIDPARNMLEKAQNHIQTLALSDRVNFIHGDTSILNSSHEKFDAALAILVLHFVPIENKATFFQEIVASLKAKGICISVDLTQIEIQEELKILKSMALKTGLSEKQSQTMIERLKQDFHLISAHEILALYHQIGLEQTKIFTQVLNYYGFIGFKV
ncbi:class I SAM-dependent methyltransferase [Acinetobacter piscicola]|uniref:class I SAM-dependent methyltransferase n=1 Tax=Acinetobacter piscicola TaxID=2006115 RepID=UPI000B7D067A|nr:class I SAM-dependent methyltransferase [Acinetobacter piscicola]